MKKNPLIVSIIGKSDSGKTTLILKLLPELKRMGCKVAVAKHCPRGFDLDIEGKDSWRFTQAGGEGIFLSSDEREAVLRSGGGWLGIKEKLQHYFSDFDVVLTEGYGDEAGIKKIQIIRNGIGGEVFLSDEIIAYVSDMSLGTDKPIYKPDDIAGVIALIESQMKI